MRSRVLVVGSKAEEEAEDEQNLEIAFRLLIDTEEWVWLVWKVVQGVTQVGVGHWGVALGLGYFRTF